MKPLPKTEIAWIRSFCNLKGDMWLRAWRGMKDKQGFMKYLGY